MQKTMSDTGHLPQESEGEAMDLREEPTTLSLLSQHTS